MSTTLLDVVQDILSSMDGDEVNSIADTVESEQVARIVVNVFNEMAATSVWAASKRLIELTASGDNTLPTHMTLPSNVKELISINYDKIKSGETKKRYDEVRYKYPDDFLRYINGRDSTSANVLTVTDPTGIELLITTNFAPSYYTSFDDETIVFDSYDSAVDNTLQSSKCQCLAYIMKTLTIADDTIIDLPPDVIPGLTEAARSKCQFELRQFQDIEAKMSAQKQARYISRRSWKVNSQQRYPNYGRKRMNMSNKFDEPTFRNEN